VNSLLSFRLLLEKVECPEADDLLVEFRGVGGIAEVCERTGHFAFERGAEQATDGAAATSLFGGDFAIIEVGDETCCFLVDFEGGAVIEEMTEVRTNGNASLFTSPELLEDRGDLELAGAARDQGNDFRSGCNTLEEGQESFNGVFLLMCCGKGPDVRQSLKSLRDFFIDRDQTKGRLKSSCSWKRDAREVIVMRWADHDNPLNGTVLTPGCERGCRDRPGVDKATMRSDDRLG
jgi:hypothetical protein